jgi:hypothetical protein
MLAGDETGSPAVEFALVFPIFIDTEGNPCTDGTTPTLNAPPPSTTPLVNTAVHQTTAGFMYF